MKARKTSKKDPASPDRYFLYRRVSSERQVEKGLSLPEQAIRQIRHVTERKGIIAGEFVDEGISASQDDITRPEFLRMLSLAKKGECDVILIYSISRFSRHKYDSWAFRQYLDKIGVRLESVTESVVGGETPSEFLGDMLLQGLAIHDAMVISEDWRRGIESRAREKGRQQGSPPYGYLWEDMNRPGGGWVIDPVASVWVRWIYDTYIQENASYMEIARQLQKLGVPPPRAGARSTIRKGGVDCYWWHNQVRNMLRNRVYTGKIHNNGNWYDGSHEPIIDDITFQRSQHVMSLRGRKKAVVGGALYNDRFLMCGKCGAIMVAKRSDTFYDGSPRRYYRCKNYADYLLYREHGREDLQQICTDIYILEREVSRLIIEECNRISSQSVINIEKALKKINIEVSDQKYNHALLAILQKELDEIPKQRKNHLIQHAKEYISDKELEEYIKELDARALSLQDQIDRLSIKHEPVKQQISKTSASLISAIIKTDKLDPAQKRMYLRSIIHHIVIHPDKQSISIYIR